MSDPRLRVMAALLAQGRALHLTAGGLALAGLALGGGAPVISVAIGAAWAAETWLAVRVGVDAALFDALAAGLEPEELDRALVGLRLAPERPARPLSARFDGAMRLWRGQVALTAGLGALAAVALLGRSP